MTPEQNGNELIEKFMPMMYCYLGSGMLTNSYDEGAAKSNAIQCAIICVEEIISAFNSFFIISVKELKYWNEVLTYLKSKTNG